MTHILNTPSVPLGRSPDDTTGAPASGLPTSVGEQMSVVIMARKRAMSANDYFEFQNNRRTPLSLEEALHYFQDTFRKRISPPTGRHARGAGGRSETYQFESVLDANLFDDALHVLDKHIRA